MIPQPSIAASPAPAAPTRARILEAVALEFGVEPTEIMGRGRSRRVARPRHVAMWLTRRLIGKSYPEIGRDFGDLDHSTVLHGCRAVDRLIAENAEMRDRVHGLLEILVGVPRDKAIAAACDRVAAETAEVLRRTAALSSAAADLLVEIRKGNQA